jgi:polyhydroxybutyrate depolymerase
MKTILTSLLLSSSLFLSAQSTISGGFNYGGVSRSYQLYVPAAYTPGTDVPVVLNLHGYGSNNTQQMAYANFKPIADTANFLILAPLGIADGTGTAHWNANWATGVDDIGFINALLDTISANYSVNQDRIYSTGMSNGGFMSLTLAGQLDNRIAAVASVTGTMSVIQVPANTVTRPVPVMQIHGDADPTVNYNGDAYFLSVDSVINYWVDHNNCNPTPVFTALANTNTTDGCTAEKYEYLGGDNGSEVVHYKILGGAHTWPDASVTIGVTNRDFNACKVIWEFFSRYEKSTLVSVFENSGENNWVSLISQNPTSGIVKLQSSTNDLFTAKVYDINGKLVANLSQKSSVLEFDISNNEAGIYIIHVIGKEQNAVLKLVKE